MQSSVHDPAKQANQHMVDRLIAEGALWSAPLMAAFRATPRHRFLDRIFQYQRKHQRWREVLTREPGSLELQLLYADRALITHISAPTPDGPGLPISSSSQPSLMAQMLEDLRLERGQRVLEIGAGTGYNAALIAHVVGPGRVTAVDVDRAVLSEAWDHLRAFPEREVTLRHADGRAASVPGGPFDRIMVTAATPDLEPAWLAQLAEQGVLLAPLAVAPGLAYVVRGTVRDGEFQGRLTRAAYFMPLRAEGETGPDEEAPLPVRDLRSLPAPWAGWFDRKRARADWVGFIQGLAFYGWLRGLAVHYQALGNREAVYGVSDGDSVCWFGGEHWHVDNPRGRELGRRLWQAFLNAGGPRPMEFELHASPRGGTPPARPESYLRQGLRCQQLWELSAHRDRPVWV